MQKDEVKRGKKKKARRRGSVIAAITCSQTKSISVSQMKKKGERGRKRVS